MCVLQRRRRTGSTDADGACIITALNGLYFLHIPKTAGSSLTRLLEDAWPAGALAPHRFVQDLVGVSREELERYEVISGHFGLHTSALRERTVTVLRDPVDRAWSHYRAYVQLRSSGAIADGYPDFESFGAFLDDRVFGSVGRDYQAHWLAVPPRPDEMWPLGLPPGAPNPNGSARRGRRAARDLERRALTTLSRCALAGTVERLDEFVEALARLLGRPLSPPPRINVGQPDKPVTRAEARRVRARSRLDTRLHAAAGEALEKALAALPPLPPLPRAELPYSYSMREPLCGSGWHARVESREAGWHRWTGPGTRSELQLPVRLGGPARVELAVISACDDDAVRSLRIRVQGQEVEHRLEPRRDGVAALADFRLDPGSPATITLEIARTCHVVEAATGERSPDPAGLAVGDIRVTPGPEASG